MKPIPTLEAARLLERKGRFKEAGSIYRKLNRSSDAQRCWRYAKVGAPSVTVSEETLRIKLGGYR